MIRLFKRFWGWMFGRKRHSYYCGVDLGDGQYTCWSVVEYDRKTGRFKVVAEGKEKR